MPVSQLFIESGTLTSANHLVFLDDCFPCNLVSVLSWFLQMVDCYVKLLVYSVEGILGGFCCLECVVKVHLQTRSSTLQLTHAEPVYFFV